MGWILRTKDDVNNPTLPGGVYGKYITIGRAVYWRYDGSRTRYLIFISDGGRYGMDSIDSVEYNGAVQDAGDYRFHPGTITKQIAPFDVNGISVSDEKWNVPGHDFSEGDLVRVGVIDGNMPTPILKSERYQVTNLGGDIFQLYDETGTTLIDMTDQGTGQVIIWKADAGFDDPDQGLPEFVPEVETTFSGISYVEGMLPTGVSSPTEQPNWDNFRFIGIGRKLMDYDNTGAEVGLISGGDEALFNLPLQVLDNFLVNYNGRLSRIGWVSWKAFRDAADVLIWQRVVDTNDDTPPTTENGFTGRYYDDEVFGNLVLTRQDPTINFPSNSDPPGPGVPAIGFSAEWSGQIKAKFSELTTLKLIHDDHGWLWVDGNLLIDESIYGTHTADYTFVEDQLYDIKIRLSQLPAGGVNPWACVFKWSSASLPEEVVPATNAVPSDITVKRYANHAAFPIAIEASEVHERLMERAPGWDWTDDDGKITFLGPDRPVVMAFRFDRMDDDTAPNIVKETFEKKRRPLADRPNFLLARWRDVLRTGFPFGFVQSDREELRIFTNGEPTNNPAEDLGVSTRSLAERILEMEMTLKSDPTYVALLSGGRRSGKIRKNQIVTCTYIDVDNNLVVDDRMLVTFHAWGSSDGRNDFSLLPIEKDFYVDEIFVEDSEFRPTETNVALSSVGATATASSEFGANFPASATNNGLRHTSGNWGSSPIGGWNSAGDPSSAAEWVEIDFGATKTIAEVDVFTLADAAQYSTDPLITDTFTSYGIVDFTVQYWNGSTWVTQTTVTGNDKVWRKFTWPDIVTNKIRVRITDAVDSYARIIELEAWGF